MARAFVKMRLYKVAENSPQGVVEFPVAPKTCKSQGQGHCVLMSYYSWGWDLSVSWVLLLCVFVLPRMSAAQVPGFELREEN